MKSKVEALEGDEEGEETCRGEEKRLGGRKVEGGRKRGKFRGKKGQHIGVSGTGYSRWWVGLGVWGVGAGGSQSSLVSAFLCP